MEVSRQRNPRPLYPREGEPAPIYRRMGGLQGKYKRMGNFRPHQDSIPGQRSQ